MGRSLRAGSALNTPAMEVPSWTALIDSGSSPATSIRVREDVHRAGGEIRDPRHDAAWPFDDRRHAEAALVEVLLEAAQVAGGVRANAGMLRAVVDVGQAAVVAGEPDQGVVGDAEFAQALAEGADGAVHGHDFGVVRPRGVVQRGEGRLVFRQGGERPVRRGVPDHREHGLPAFPLLRDVAERFRDQDFRRVALELLRHSVLTEDGVQVELVRVAQPVVEAQLARDCGGRLGGADCRRSGGPGSDATCRSAPSRSRPAGTPRRATSPAC